MTSLATSLPVPQWLERPTGDGRSWVRFPSGTQIFSLSHARDMLNIPSFLKFQNLCVKSFQNSRQCSLYKHANLYLLTEYMRSRDGAVVKALAFHQCGPGSIPGPGVICGLSLLLVLFLVPKVFLRVLRFSSFHKNQHFQIPIPPACEAHLNIST